MGAVVLLALYGLIVTTLAGYRAIDYIRIYTVLGPLLFLTMGGTLLAPFLLTQPFDRCARFLDHAPLAYTI